MAGGKALGLLAVIATAGGWLGSGFVARRPSPHPPDEPFPVSRTEVGRATARLSSGLASLSSSGRGPYVAPARNPFLFGSNPGAARAVSGLPPDPRIGAAETARGSSERPSMQLIGMAEDPGSDGPVRRAVITAAGQLFVVGKGQLVLNRFRIGRMDVDVVELEDLEGGPPTILALR